MSHHTSDSECPLCKEKLTTADPRIVEWFLEMKKEFPNAHVSWAYRGKEDQDKMFAGGKSRATFPHSKHNVEQDGNPCSQALDLFELKNEKAFFSSTFYFSINQYSKSLGHLVKWGGEFRKIGDGDHFEITA